MLRQRMMVRHHAAPAQHAHIAKREAPANRNRLCGTDGKFHAPVRQRVPDAVKHLLRHLQLHIREVPVEIEHQPPDAFRAHDIVHRDGELPAPAVGNLLALLTGDHHFFDDRTPLAQKPGPGGCQNHITMAALEERHRKPLLKLAHRIADGRRHAVQFCRCCGETAGARHGVHHFEGIFRPHFLPANFLNGTGKY